MGWQLGIKKTKKETKYRIWTTITDSWITKWASKEEIIKFLFWHRFNKLMEEFTQDAMTFPNGYTEKGNGRRIMTENSDEYYKFAVGKYKVSNKNAFEVSAEKFKELITNSGIEVTVKDSDGYSF